MRLAPHAARKKYRVSSSALRVALLRRACTPTPRPVHRGRVLPFGYTWGFWRRFLGFFIDDILC